MMTGEATFKQLFTELSKILTKLNFCMMCSLNIGNSWAGALVQWLWEETHVPKVVGLNPSAVYWMDMAFFHIDLL